MTKLLRTCLCAGLLLTASRLMAQDTTRVGHDSTRTQPPLARGAPGLLIDVTYHSGGGERVRAFLARGLVYRAEFSEPNIQMEMYSYEGKALPFVLPVVEGPDVSGRTTLELRPQVDGEVEFRPVFVASGVAVTFKLWNIGDDHINDVVDSTPHFPMELGVMVESGSHGAYVNRLDYGGSGSSVGACLAIRNGGGILKRMWGCAVGVEVAGGANDGSATYLYTEPRVRIAGARPHRGVSIEGGLLFRLGARSASTLSVADDPAGETMYGLGAYAGVQSWEQGGGGWTLMASLMGQQVTSRAPESSGAGTTAFRVTFGRFF